MDLKLKKYIYNIMTSQSRSIDNLERVPKKNEQIIDLLINDTKKDKIYWYTDNPNDFIYTRMIKLYSDKRGDTRIDIIFKLSDSIYEEEFEYPEMGYASYEFQNLFNSITTLDIYIKKNNKKEIFCKRISDYQMKLDELMRLVIIVMKKNPSK
jgi:hypothetical protein